MNSTQRPIRGLLALALSALLAACGLPSLAQPTSTPVPTATPLPTPTLVPTSTPVPPTATPVPPTATRVPPTATATTAPPTSTRAATATAQPTTGAGPLVMPTIALGGPRGTATAGRPAAGAPAGKVRDSEGACEMTLPAGFSEDEAGSGNLTSDDEQAFANLSSFASSGLGLETEASFFVEAFKGLIDNYVETNRTTDQLRGRDVVAVDFTGELEGQPVAGSFVFLEDRSTVCSLTFISFASAADRYQPALETMILSLEVIKP